MLNSSKYPLENDECFRLDVINKFVSEIIDNSEYDLIDGVKNKQHVDVLNDVEKIQDSVEAKPNPKLELKQLPSHLRYAFLGDSSIFSVIISTHLFAE